VSHLVGEPVRAQGVGWRSP